MVVPTLTLSIVAVFAVKDGAGHTFGIGPGNGLGVLFKLVPVEEMGMELFLDDPQLLKPMLRTPKTNIIAKKCFKILSPSIRSFQLLYPDLYFKQSMYLREN
jgi:hypothetical protein